MSQRFQDQAGPTPCRERVACSWHRHHYVRANHPSQSARSRTAVPRRSALPKNRTVPLGAPPRSNAASLVRAARSSRRSVHAFGSSSVGSSGSASRADTANRGATSLGVVRTARAVPQRRGSGQGLRERLAMGRGRRRREPGGCGRGGIGDPQSRPRALGHKGSHRLCRSKIATERPRNPGGSGGPRRETWHTSSGRACHADMGGPRDSDSATSSARPGASPTSRQ